MSSDWVREPAGILTAVISPELELDEDDANSDSGIRDHRGGYIARLFEIKATTVAGCVRHRRNVQLLSNCMKTH